MQKFLNAIFSWIPQYQKGGSNAIKIAANAGIGFLAVFLAFAGIQAITRSIEQRVSAAKSKLTLFRDVEMRQATFTDLRSDFKRLEPFLPALAAALPSAEEMRAFSDAAEQIAKQTGNRITFQFDGREPDQDAKFSDVLRVGFSAVLEGNRESFAAFIGELGRSRYFTSIEQIRIDSSQGFNGPAKMNFQGAVFIRK
ncbi:MAG: hypothetical protein G01um101433_150 [Parcubacteria group bacterium Gr01-1014_33]|nr:MAG: hypothetical protein G01um101433_150 [Parcubacteria group bacterium Gr01-1014_33]